MKSNSRFYKVVCIFFLTFLVSVCQFSFAAIQDVIFYYNKSQVYQQVQFDELYKRKYRIVSLNVSGSTNDPRYACVWVQDDKWEPFHSFSVANVDGYQAKFEEWTRKGFVPNILSATGDDPNHCIFTGTFIKKQGDIPYTRSKLTETEFQETIQLAREKDWVPIWLNAYGNEKNKYYTGIFGPNTEKVLWEIASDETAAELQERYEAHKYNRVRPAFFTHEPSRKLTSVYQNDEIGGFVYFSNLTLRGVDEKVEEFKKKLLFPIRIEAYGTGNAARYAVLFSKRIVPEEKTFSMTGRAVPFTADLDSKVKEIMKENNIKGIGIAIAYKGRLIHARGYTNAESGYPRTKPTDRFRVASLSKSLTAIAMIKEIEDSGGQLTINSRIEDVLGMDFQDQRFSLVTLGHLLTHESALISNYENPGLVSASENNNRFPITSAMRLQWFSDQAPIFVGGNLPPGSASQYCNLGYWLLGQGLGQRDPQRGYEGQMRRHVFAPLGLNDPALASVRTRKNEVIYQHNRLTLRTSFQGDGKLAPVAYQAGLFNLKEASGGWSLSPAAYVKVLAAFCSNIDNPLMSEASERQLFRRAPRNAGFTYGFEFQTLRNSEGDRILVRKKGGLLPDIASSTAGFRSDDVCYVVFANKHVPGVVGAIESEIHELANKSKAADWPANDLFPSLGIPSF